MSLDVKTIRKDFPILDRQVRGKKLTYLDNAATTQRPNQVVDAMSHFYRHSNANVHRSIHQLGEEATEAYLEAHAKVARFIGGSGAEEVVFTKNCTEAINVAAYGWALKTLKSGDEVVISLLEHHSNIVPWQQMAKRAGASLQVVGVTPDGQFDLEHYKSLLSRKTKIVAVTGMSNVMGTITPVKEISRLAHEVGAVVLVDGAQSVPHIKTNVQDIGCDLLVFSGHKMLGPTGIGVLWGTREMLTKMDPMLFGGEMIRRVTHEESSWNDLPWKFEAGTPVIAEAVGLSAAIDYIEKIGLDAIHKHEVELVRYAYDKLSAIPNLKIFGPKPEHRGGVVSFAFDDIHAHDLASLLDERGIAVRAGHHCAQPLMAYLCVPSTARASFYMYNTKDEIDVLADALSHAREVFKL